MLHPLLKQRLCTLRFRRVGKYLYKASECRRQKRKVEKYKLQISACYLNLLSVNLCIILIFSFLYYRYTALLIVSYFHSKEENQNILCIVTIWQYIKILWKVTNLMHDEFKKWLWKIPKRICTIDYLGSNSLWSKIQGLHRLIYGLQYYKLVKKNPLCTKLHRIGLMGKYHCWPILSINLLFLQMILKILRPIRMKW